MKKTKAYIAHEVVTMARNIVEALYAEDVLEFSDEKIEKCFYALNDICIAFTRIWEEEAKEDEKDA